MSLLLEVWRQLLLLVLVLLLILLLLLLLLLELMLKGLLVRSRPMSWPRALALTLLLCWPGLTHLILLLLVLLLLSLQGLCTSGSRCLSPAIPCVFLRHLPFGNQPLQMLSKLLKSLLMIWRQRWKILRRLCFPLRSRRWRRALRWWWNTLTTRPWLCCLCRLTSLRARHLVHPPLLKGPKQLSVPVAQPLWCLSWRRNLIAPSFTIRVWVCDC